MIIYMIKSFLLSDGVVDELFKFKSKAEKRKLELQDRGLFVTPVVRIKVNEDKK